MAPWACSLVLSPQTLPSAPQWTKLLRVRDRDLLVDPPIFSPPSRPVNFRRHTKIHLIQTLLIGTSPLILILHAPRDVPQNSPRIPMPTRNPPSTRQMHQAPSGTLPHTRIPKHQPPLLLATVRLNPAPLPIQPTLVPTALCPLSSLTRSSDRLLPWLLGPHLASQRQRMSSSARPRIPRRLRRSSLSLLLQNSRRTIGILDPIPGVSGLALWLRISSHRTAILPRL